jgi:hypothetical protein
VQYSKLNCPTLPGEELIGKNCSSKAKQLTPGENNRSDHRAQTGRELPQAPIAASPVDRRNQILLRSQSPNKTTSELLLAMDIWPIRPKKLGKKQNKIKQKNSCLTPKSSENRGSTLP